MIQIPDNPQWENTYLTLDKRGLDAVKSFLKRAADGTPPPKRPTLEERQLSLWEPPIDNECP